MRHRMRIAQVRRMVAREVTGGVSWIHPSRARVDVDMGAGGPVTSRGPKCYPHKMASRLLREKKMPRISNLTPESRPARPAYNNGRGSGADQVRLHGLWADGHEHVSTGPTASGCIGDAKRRGRQAMTLHMDNCQQR